MSQWVQIFCRLYCIKEMTKIDHCLSPFFRNGARIRVLLLVFIAWVVDGYPN